jgi:hypothetical protein
MSHHCKMLLSSAAIALLLTGSVLAGTVPRILRVVDRPPPIGEAAASPSFNVLHIGKFADERTDVDGHSFDVHWIPADGGSPAGTLVLFEYRQQDPTVVRRLEVKYPFRVNERRRASFKISGEAFRQGGLVTAWRVRIMDGDNILAEEQSKSWR